MKTYRQGDTQPVQFVLQFEIFFESRLLVMRNVHILRFPAAKLHPGRILAGHVLRFQFLLIEAIEKERVTKWIPKLATKHLITPKSCVSSSLSINRYIELIDWLESEFFSKICNFDVKSSFAIFMHISQSKSSFFLKIINNLLETDMKRRKRDTQQKLPKRKRNIQPTHRITAHVL